ncbi:MAG: PKD domain-containing protein [Thermoleophilia bacterium]
MGRARTRTGMAAAAAVVGVAASLASAGAAGAATYCVGAPCDGGTLQPGLQAALDAAAADAGADLIRIAPGTYDGVFSYEAIGPVEIAGAGAGATLLRNTAVPDEETLRVLAGPGSAIHDLGAETGPVGASSPRAIQVRDVAVSRVRVTAPAAEAQVTGIEFLGTSSLTDSEVETPAAYGIVSLGDLTLTRVRVRAAYGFFQAFGDPDAVITGSTFDATYFAVEADDGTVAIRNTVIRSTGPTGTGLMALARNVGDAPAITARHVTITSSSGEFVGASAANIAGAGASASVALYSTTVSGGTAPVQAYTTGAGTATVVGDHANHWPAATSQTGTGTVALGPTSISVDPGFIAGPGDLRLRHDSPLIDAGDPSDGGGSYGAGDVRGLPRVVGARRDIGAYEYQFAPPVAVATATATGGLGARFDGSASSDPDGDPLVHAWAFPDAVGATGAVVDRAFAAAGARSGTLTVTDPTGRSATATASVVVGGPGPGAGAAPRLSALKVSPRRALLARKASRGRRALPARPAVIGVTASDAGRLRVVAERRTTGRRRGMRCVAPTRALVRARARTCVRYVKGATITRRVAAGAVKVSFTGRVGRRTLPIGTYRLTLTLTNAAGVAGAPLRTTVGLARR